ncbi:dipeptide/oligopeptide/nickel ABC transporter permease/ATP-binding protein [Amycolatopsis sp.]|uniref:dipeptide/oligopeptide/nickel ABC transporter permease/ATP-binding protein n=1 Tax=Amycolatopsis sp. TaxID=37632 RepID=UPI002CD5BF49|nr:dipeptide/oligopeptide/nickel ABC transporter permease/ATP-binding protein [Amycolatopsis sp.]HVV12145.1 dipeptide/oligopeptide/nickel ABC transporter permease/ATP-binding protein [Amycolatopsis sp.]
MTTTDPARGVWRGLLRKPLGLTSACFLGVLAVVSVVVPLTGVDPERQDLGAALSGPAPAHWLGTDRLGRDVLVRLLSGTRYTLLDVLVAVAVFTVLGVVLGVVAGFVGRWADRLIGRFGDLLLALPGIIVLLMVLAVFPGNDAAAMVALGVMSCPLLLRVVRGMTISLRNELYVKAARLSGLTETRIMLRHILPRLAGPIIVQVSLFAAAAVLAQSALSFLGLARPETEGPSWGNMVAEASNVISKDPWLLVPTGGILALTVLALGLLGDAVRDLTVGRSRPEPVRWDGLSRSPAAAPRAAGNLLSVKGLGIEFGTTVVRDVSFEVAAGEAVGIVGESGCGKTVTARALLGLLPGSGRVSSGSVVFDGQELIGLADRELARIRGSRIGLVSQEPLSGLDPSFRVRGQLVEVIRRHRRMPRRDARARAAELLELVRLPADVARRYPHELSGGMAQRVSIALALAGEPALLIADEPTTALDVTVQAGILALLRELRTRLGMAIILVTHDWGVLADLCDRALVMYAGEVTEQAGVEELYAAPRHPYTEGLLAANPRLAPAGDLLPAIPGSVPAPADWPPGCHFQPRCPYATTECGTGPILLTELGAGRVSRCIHSDEMAVR